MATDVGLADGQSVNAAYFNARIPFIAGANKNNVKICYARIRYTGSAWEVSSSADSAGIVSGNVAWSTDHINITLSGYTAAPVVVVGTTYVSGVARIPHGIGASASQAQVYWYDYAGSLDSTQGTDMDIQVIIIGL